MPGLHFDSSIDFKKIDQDVKQIEGRISGLSRSTEQAGDKMDATFRRVGAAVGAYFSVRALSDFAMQVTNVRGEFQQLDIALQSMLGNKEVADKLMADVVDMAAKTPFKLTELGQAAKQLIAVQEPAEDVIDSLKRLGDISAGLSVPIGQLIKAYGDVRAKGRLMGQEMLQFMNAGVPMVAQLAKHLNVSEGEVSDLVSKGLVGFEDVKAVLANLADEGGMFYNLMEKQSASLTGQISILGDAWAQMLNDVGEDNEGAISGTLQTLISLVQNYETVIDVLKVVIVTYGAYRAALILTSLAKSGMTAAETLHYGALVMVEKAQKLLNATMLKNPYVAVATVLTALVSSLIVFSKKAKEVSLAQEAMAKVSEKVSDSLGRQQLKIEQLRKTAKNQELIDRQRLEAIEELKEIMPEYNAEISEEGKLINENTDAIKAYLTQLELKIKMQAVEDEMVELWKKEREELKLLEEAQKRYNAQKARDSLSSVYGGEAGIAGSVSKAGTLIAADNAQKKAENNLKKTRDAIKELREEYTSAEKSMADFFKKAGGDGGEIEIQTIKDLENELSALEKRRKEETDRGDKEELDRLGKLIIAKKQEIEKFKVTIQKDDDRTELEKFEDRIKTQKELYSQYEAYKKVVGEKEASEMYADLTKQGEDYLSFLQTLLNTLPAGDKKAIVATEIVATDKREEKEFDIEGLIERTASMNQKLLNLDKKYQQEKAELEKIGADENLEILKESYEAERQAIIEANAFKSDSYKWVYEELENMSRKTLKTYIENLRKELEAKAWSDEAKLMLSEKLAEAEQKLAENLPDTFSKVGGVLREAASLASELDENLALAINTAAELAEGASAIAAGLATGNAFQVAGGVLQMLTSLVKLTGNYATMADKTEEVTATIAEMNKQLERQQRLFENLSEDSKLGGYIAMLEEIGDKSDETKQKMIDLIKSASGSAWDGNVGEKLAAWLHGNKGERDEAQALVDTIKKLGLSVGNVENWTEADWVRLIGEASGETKEQLEALYDQWVSLQDQQEEYYNQWAEASTGMSFDSFADEFLSALKSGERSAQDFSDNVEDMLRKAIIQGFKTQYLVDALKPWYDQFAEFSQDGLSESEIEMLRDKFQQIFAEAGAAFDALGDVVDLGGADGNDPNSLSGAIKGMSQESADLLAGQFNALRINTADHLNVAKNALIHQAATANNTRHLVNLLITINEELTIGAAPSPNVLRAKGL